MVAGLAGTIGQLAVRTLVQRELGAVSLGHFQAAWMISMTYIGFVLSAMGTDYYPRLTASIHDCAITNRIVNEQTEIALLLAAPVLLAMLGLAPMVIQVLYSSSFIDAVAILRWQILGDVLKVASWPLGYIMLAAGDGRAFVLAESVCMAVFVGLTWVGLPLFGIEATGIAFLSMYIIYLPAVHWLGRRRTGFRWSPEVRRQLAFLAAGAIAIAAAAHWSGVAGITAGLLGGSVASWYAMSRLASVTGAGGTLGKIAGLSRRLLLQPRRHRSLV
jgi:PST family polysaccharide transporter